jgi:UDPglucose 6-dehydrogenase
VVLAVLDPKVSERQIAADLGEARDSGEGSWPLVADANQAASGADGLLLLTEWPQFAALDWAALAAVMRHPAWLFDARAVANAAAAQAAGLRVWVVGDGEG